MGSIYRNILPILFILGSIISTWFLVANLQSISSVSFAVLACALSGAYLVVKVLDKNLISSAKKHALGLVRRKYFVSVALATIVMLGLLARLFFYFKFSYSPISDPMTFYDSAKTIAAGGSLQGNDYVAFQPYLAAYNNILGMAMRIISDPWLATILLNTCFDIIAAILVFILVKCLSKPGSQIPVVAFGLWMLNPLNVVFSVLSLPVIIVNLFIILAILISYLLIQSVIKLETKHSLLLSLALGVALGLGNCFRPIFIVVIIALAIVFIIAFLKVNRSTRFLKLFTVCILFSSLIFTGVQMLNVTYVSSQTGLPAAKNPSGWSIYVGSNWESAGQWRSYANEEMSVICQESLVHKNYDECHDKLQNVAIDRYKEYGLLGSASHFLRKLYHQAEQQNYLYNAEQSIVGYVDSRTSKLINLCLVIYIIALFILSAKFLYGLAEQYTPDKVSYMLLVFVTLLMVGWFFSFMFVESAPRYSTIMYPAFIIFSALFVSRGVSKKSKPR